MHLIRIGAAALNQTPLDWDGNRDRIVAAIAAARAEGVSILCLPELCITGYGCEDAFLAPGVQKLAWQMLEEIEPHTHGMIAAVGLPEVETKLNALGWHWSAQDRTWGREVQSKARAA